jgi:hypothetical protein
LFDDEEIQVQAADFLAADKIVGEGIKIGQEAEFSAKSDR